MKKLIISSIISMVLVGSTLVYADTFTTLDQNQSTAVTSTEINPKPVCLTPEKNLKYGDGVKNQKHSDVKLLQEHLIERGYLKGQPTGYFGILTLNAVKKLQKEEGVSSTGFVGAQTLQKIKAKCDIPTMVCDYAAPPSGCTYVAGPKYDAKSQCGMVLSCGGNTPYEPPTNRKSWNDGCNICGKTTIDGPAFCTKRACPSEINYGLNGKCNEYFSTSTKTCSVGDKTYTEGQSTGCIKDTNGATICIADAAYFCRDGVWKIEGSYPMRPLDKTIACTMEARMCSDGSMMPRDANCTWHPESCPTK